MKRPHWRKTTWALIIWTALILIWAIAGAGSTGDDVDDCVREGVLSRQTCQDAVDAGTGLGVALILFIGFVGFVFLSLIWLMTRSRKRQCPVCGEDVRKGRTVCKSCGHDFAAGHSSAPATL